MAENILEKFQPEETKRLEDAFRESHHPDTLSLRFLAAEIGIPNDEVQVNWKYFTIKISKDFC